MKIKKSHLNIGLLLFILLITITGMIYQGGTPQYKIETPKTSDGEITILTPENKTYTEPMHGYYPATYGFENELDGTSRTNIAYVDGTNLIQSNCEVEIVNNYQGHNKVLRIHDGNTNGNAAAEHYFDSIQTTGTIEWWWITPVSGSNTISYHFHEGIMGTHIGGLDMQDGNFWDMEQNAIQAHVTNKWYHNKVTFSTISDTYDWYIDGVLRVDDGNFENPVNNMGSTDIKGGWISTGTCYVDAITHSWDIDYMVGSNFHEGILLSYDTSENLEWQGYSLDGQANKTIIGSTTIQMPSYGSHNIQVFGNNSLGTMYHSSIRYFSISPINILTPENKTYTEPMHGYYPASFGFESDENGAIPDEWTDLTPSGSCSIAVQDQKDSHQKVVFISDADTGIGGGADATAQYNFKTPKTTGIIECWVYKESGDCALIIQGNNDTTTGFIISIDAENNGLFRYSPAPSTYFGFAAGKYSDQEWFHLRIDFDCDTGTTDIYVNGVKEVENGLFHLPVPDISFIMIRSGYSGRSGEIYYDAVGLSWDSNYNIGDNMDEGLLLSYENSTNLNWKGYSLDGLVNKRILGKTSIPMPSNGHHRIQMFANDSIGTMHESNVQYFSVDTTSFINIITPENTGYFEPMNGYYLGTTGFEDTDNGLLPPNMDDIHSGTNCQATVVSEKMDHNKVVHIDDDSSITKVRVNYNFTDLDYGFLEFWVLAEDATFGLVMHFWDDDTETDLFRFNINYDKWHYYIDSNWYVIPAFDGSYNPQDNTWYHVEVHFRGNDAPAYKGLNENQYKLIIDGRDSGRINFDNNGASIERLKFFTGDASTSDFWVDAFGVISDLNYILNDNLYEGLLLSFDHSDNFDWIGYSLDGNPNITITGNKVIKTEVGTHSIILNGINFEGMMIQSDLRYFITYYQNNPPPILPNPNLIPILITSITFGIITLLGITLLLLRKKTSPRTSSIMTSPPERSSTQIVENVDFRLEQINFCPVCGANADNTYQFCANCGASFKDV